jgi:hypothetical protein
MNSAISIYRKYPYQYPLLSTRVEKENLKFSTANNTKTMTLFHSNNGVYTHQTSSNTIEIKS